MDQSSSLSSLNPASDSSRLLSVIQKDVLLSACSGDVWEWGGLSTCTSMLGKDKQAPAYPPTLCPEEGDRVLLEQYMKRHRQKLGALLDAFSKSRCGDEEKAGNSTLRKGLWMDFTGMRVAHKAFVDILVALDKSLEIILKNTTEAATDIETTALEINERRESIEQDAIKRCQALKIGGSQLSQSVDRLMKEIQAMNNEAQRLRDPRHPPVPKRSHSSPQRMLKNTIIRTRHGQDDPVNGMEATAKVPPRRWDKLVAMNPCLRRSVPRSSCPSELFRFIGIKEAEPKRLQNTGRGRSRSVSFSLTGSPTKSRSTRGRSLDSIKRSIKKLTSVEESYKKLVLNGKSPPITANVSSRPPLICKRLEQLEMSRPREAKPSAEKETFATKGSHSSGNQYNVINGWEIPSLDLQFLSDDETVKSKCGLKVASSFPVGRGTMNCSSKPPICLN